MKFPMWDIRAHLSQYSNNGRSRTSQNYIIAYIIRRTRTAVPTPYGHYDALPWGFDRLRKRCRCNVPGRA